MTETSAREIAAGLSEAQKQSILQATDLMSTFGGYPFLTARITNDPWPKGIAEFLTLKSDRLTPLGLAVRAILQELNP